MIEQLKNVLPIHLYGVGQAKQFNCLLAEIEAGETQIIWEQNQSIRLIQVARVYVFYGNLKLVETRQTIKGQCDRVRNIDCVSEKFYSHEFSDVAACRGIREELGIPESEPITLYYLGYKVELKESPSYPGLLTQYGFHDFRWGMPDKFYKPEGYVADEGDCVTYFEWK